MGDLGDGDHAVAVELASHDHEAGLEIDVADLHAGRLAHAQARGIDKLEEGPVAQAVGRRGIDGLKKTRDFLPCKGSALPS